MAIVSSVIVSIGVQADGRRWVHELHIAANGDQFPVHYLAPAVFDTAAALAARAIQISADLVANETERNVAAVKADGADAVLSFIYISDTDTYARLRREYEFARGRDAAAIGYFLSTLRDAQLQTAFGYNAGQVTALRKTRLTPQAATASSVRNALGQ